MVDVKTPFGEVRVATTANCSLNHDPIYINTNPAFFENVSTFVVGPRVVIDGIPYADEAGVKQTTKSGVDSSTVLTAAVNRRTLFPSALAHWIPGAAETTLDTFGRRWWPVDSPRDAASPRMDVFKQNRDPASNGAAPYGDGVGAPFVEADYSYQGFGEALDRPAYIFDHRGYMKIDTKAGFPSGTFALTAVFHPGPYPYFGIFEATTSTGIALILEWAHGKLRLLANDALQLVHESHRRSATAVALLVSLDSVSDVGKFFCVDGNRTTRTLNIDGLEFTAFLGIFGGIGQGAVPPGVQYGLTADMDVLDVAIWSYAMDWPELEATANLLSVAYGVGG